MSNWRDHARPIIAQVLAETRGQDEKAIRKALHDAYPFGQRAMHPYQIWLNEIKRQRGTYRTPQQRREKIEGQDDLFQGGNEG